MLILNITTIFLIIGVITLVVAFILTIHSYFWRDKILEWKFLAILFVVGSIFVLSYKYNVKRINIADVVEIEMAHEAENYNNLNSEFIIVAQALPPEKRTNILIGTAENTATYKQFKKSKKEEERVKMFNKLKEGVGGTQTAVIEAIKETQGITIKKFDPIISK